MNVREELKSNSIEENQAIARSTTKNFAVATFDLKGDLNLGVIMRTAHLCGAKDFFILNHRQWDRRSAVGVQNYLNVEKHDECKDWNSSREFLASRKYIGIVVEHGGKLLKEFIPRYKELFTDDKPYSPCFIFGPEDTGFDETWPRHIELEQTGVTRSYNVSAAAAIILYNWSFGK
jgi:tRNA G18 (ribose-2'-O)-methylase SpoU